MKDIEQTRIHTLSDRELLRRVEELVVDSRRTTAELVAHLMEVERRDLHLELAFKSLYAYCTEKLGLDEGAAYLRIRAARLARQFPRVLSMLAFGTLHLAGLSLLSSKLTQANHQQLLDAASGKSKRSIERLLVSRFPKTAPRQRVRKLPEKPSAREETLPLLALASGNSAAGKSSESSGQSAPAVGNPATLDAPDSASPTTPPKSSWERPAAAWSLGQRRGACRPVTPISGSLYKVQFTASPKLIRKLNTVRALASHRNPKGDLEPLFDQALTLLLEQLEKQRFAVKGNSKRKRKTRSRKDASSSKLEPTPATIATTLPGKSSAPNPAPAPTTVGDSAPGKPVEGRPTTRRSRHIPNEIRRLVFERDAGRCTFVAADGRRCDATHFLEFEHKLPWARSGRHSLENVVLMCRSHNQLRAREQFPQAVAEATRE